MERHEEKGSFFRRASGGFSALENQAGRRAAERGGLQRAAAREINTLMDQYRNNNWDFPCGAPANQPTGTAASALAASEIASPQGSLAVTTCSNPVPVGVLDLLVWKWRSIAAQHRNDAGKHTTDYYRIKLEASAEALEACALELRLLTDDVTGRQPESNVEMTGANPKTTES